MKATQSQNGNFFVNTIHAWGYSLIPSLRSYRCLLSLIDDRSWLKTSIGWIAISFSISSIAIMLEFLLFEGFNTEPQPSLIMLLPLLVLPLLFVIIGLIEAGFTAGVAQIVARGLGGNGAFSSLFFTYASLISSVYVLTAIGYIGIRLMFGIHGYPWLSIMVAYQVVLSVFANKVSHELNWFKAAISAIPMLAFNTLPFLIIQP
ncbi:MAG: hypothetical protein JXJ17_18510 [Anaerolineae bacterium]|nr:hypothetical protein [Anaerolineae bacterium]